MEELLLELFEIKEEQKKDKAHISFLEGFVKGLEHRITELEKRFDND